MSTRATPLLPVLLLLLASAIVLASIAAGAQQPGKVPRIGYVAGGPLPFREGFRRGLPELGYVEGQNVLVEYRWTGGRAEAAQELLAELVALNVDVIVAVGPPPVYAAKRATTTIPIVMVGVVEPAAAGIVASLARPSGNVTGLAFDVSPEIVRKLLELLKEAAPRASRAVVLWNPANPGDRPYVTELQAAAAALRVALAIVEVRTPEGLDRAFTAILEHRPDALVVLSDPLLNVHRKPIVAFAAKNRIPTAYRLRDAVDDGGLMSYAVNLTELNRRAASYVDRILKGAKPGDLPVEQPTKFELVINLKTAKALGLTIPPSLLVRADQVIE